jgi:hypothetical protein
MSKKHLPDIVYNPISVAGAALATISFLSIVFLTLVDAFTDHPAAYIGIIAYIVIPIPLITGLLLIAFGILREQRRRRHGLPIHTLTFRFDPADPQQRRAMMIFVNVTGLFVLFTAYGSYRSFEWTESVEFCGATCHEPMHPEYTAYQNSPHARVKCVDCHVGAGATWYVRSKLSGAYQVYAVLANVYPRPIPTPIKNLRPARETCEQCHWPSHFSGKKEYINTYFRSDEANTRWTIAMLMNIGGGDSTRGSGIGSHWHMNPDIEIHYAATDSLHQSIPYVRLLHRQSGETTEFVSSEAGLPPDSLRLLASSKMDCIDCHNRPSHIYRPPVRIVDRSLALGRISTELPNIRSVSVSALTADYTTNAAAMDSIPKILEAYYRENYAATFDQKLPLIRKAGDELKGQYSLNFFPEMHVSWKAYPNNIGHMTDLGCFRCHDGLHAAADGTVISKDCNLCHTILYQGSDPVPQTLNAAGLPFQHPEDIGDMWQITQCKECHSGQ